MGVPTEERIHDVLTLHPGISIGAMHHLVRAYDSQWRSTLERLVMKGEVRVEHVAFKGKLRKRYYTLKPTDTVVVLKELALPPLQGRDS